MSRKRILMTGGTGFFGKSILDYFSRHVCDYEFHVLSRHGGDIVGDVATFEFPSEHYDVILHLASPVLGQLSDEETERAIVAGTRHVAEFAQLNEARLLFASSGAVYGNHKGPIGEDTICDPITGYGRGKLFSERYFTDKGLDVKIARCFAFVGRHLNRNAHFAIGNFIRDALADKDIVIRGDGTSMRSYMYADDLVEWLFAILEHGESGRPYNVGSPEAISIRNLAMTIRDTLGSRCDVKVQGARVSGAADFYVPDVSRANRELGLNKKVNLITAIRESIA